VRGSRSTLETIIVMAKSKTPTSKAAKPAATPTSARGLTKAGLIAVLSEQTGLTKKNVGDVLDNLASVAGKNLKASGVFLVPGIAKLRVTEKAAKPAHEGINPFTKQAMHFDAKPASKAVKAKILADLRNAVA
jgi:nucleoid DNA-binding protein